MDGSLVDSMWMWPEVDREYMKKHKITPPETFHKDIEGMSYVQTAQYFLDQFPVLDCAVEDICREWTEMTRELYRTRVPWGSPPAIPGSWHLRLWTPCISGIIFLQSLHPMKYKTESLPRMST